MVKTEKRKKLNRIYLHKVTIRGNVIYKIKTSKKTKIDKIKIRGRAIYKIKM